MTAVALDRLVIRHPLTPAEQAGLPATWARLTTSKTTPRFEFRPEAEAPRRRATDLPAKTEEAA